MPDVATEANAVAEADMGKAGTEANAETEASTSKEDTGQIEMVEFPVPDDVDPGESIEVHVGPQKESVVLKIPACTRPGDRLRLSRPAGAGREAWRCSLLTSKAAPEKAGPEEESGIAGNETTYVRVPENAEGKLRVEVRGHVLTLAMPPKVKAGDYLELVQGEHGRWRCTKLAAGTPAAAAAAEALCGRTIMSKLRPTRRPASGAPSAQVLYERLIAAARGAGAFVTPKINRGSAPPLNIIGMIAQEDIDDDEVLVRMPLRMHLSPTLAQKVMPRLAEAVGSLAKIPQGRHAETIQAACLAMLFTRSERMFEQGFDADGDYPAGDASKPPAATRGDSSEEGDDEAALLELWGRYADSLVYEPFEKHPYWRAMDNLKDFIMATEPSLEHEYIAMMANDVPAVAGTLKTGIDPEILGENFDVGAFMQARLCILTRVFHVHGESNLVPIADLFNHSNPPSAKADLDMEAEDFLIKATRGIARGEEISISYGPRSNTLLFRTYGFTLPPEMEPSWSIVTCTQKSKAAEEYLPERMRKLPIHFESTVLQDSVIKALNTCLESGRDALAFLRELLSELIAAYDASAKFAAGREALERVRASDPTSGAWWTALEMPTDELALHALRVNMSEYLCLTAHLEALGFVDGAVAEEQCLAGASGLRDSVKDAVARLRDGQCVDRQRDAATITHG